MPVQQLFSGKSKTNISCDLKEKMAAFDFTFLQMIFEASINQQLVFWRDWSFFLTQIASF